MKFRFKTIYALRDHCKKQLEHKCEICLQAFCKRSALKAHREEGCERVLETPNEPCIEDNKPTFVDCISEPTPCVDQYADASFICEIIPKKDEINENENENTEDIKQNDKMVDDLNHAGTSYQNENVSLKIYRPRRQHKTKAKKFKKGKHRQRNTIYEYDNMDGTDESSDTKYHCYLCNRR